MSGSLVRTVTLQRCVWPLSAGALPRRGQAEMHHGIDEQAELRWIACSRKERSFITNMPCLLTGMECRKEEPGHNK